MNEETNKGKQNRSLFKEDFFDDWILIISFSIIAIGIFLSSKNFGHFSSLSSSDWITLGVDNGVTAGINFVILALIPASIRRYFRLKRNSDSSEYEPTKELKLVGLLLLTVIASSILGTASSTKEVERSAATQEECQSTEDYEFCLKATRLEERKFEFISLWKYSVEKVISRSQVSSIEVKSIIDCEEKVGTLDHLYVFGMNGQRVGLLKSDLDSMLANFQKIHVDKLVSKQCEQQ